MRNNDDIRDSITRKCMPLINKKVCSRTKDPQISCGIHRYAIAATRNQRRMMGSEAAGNVQLISVILPAGQEYGWCECNIDLREAEGKGD